MNSWFISDLHLEDVLERNSQTLLRFLFFLNQNPKNHRLFLLGDIFDVWVSDGSTFDRKFKLIVDQIVKLKKNGGEVYYFEGNHDVHLKKFWTDRHQIPVYVEPQIFELDGLNVRAEHGDFINPHDTAYLKWLKILRHPAMIYLGETVPSWFWSLAASKHSKKSRRKTSRYAQNNSENIRQLIRNFAKKAIDGKVDLIVTGHMHVFDDFTFEIDGRMFRSINLGSWLDQPRVLKLEGHKITVLNLEKDSYVD